MKKNHSHTRAAIQSKARFPEDRHVLTPAQREVPNPAGAIAAMAYPQPSERVHLRAATVSQEQREAQARREALAILEQEDARRDALAHAGVPSDDLHARRWPLGAPMATRIGSMPDPLAVLAWDAVLDDAGQTVRRLWGKWAFTAALAVWSAACFILGRLA